MIQGIYSQNGFTAINGKVLGMPKKDYEAIQRRWYYEEDINNLFKSTPKQDRPVVRGGLTTAIIDKSVGYLFPEGTEIKVPDESLQETVNGLLKSTKILNKLNYIGTEGHVTGTVMLKSTLNEDNTWNLDIRCLESFYIETDPLNVEKVLSYTIRFRYMEDGKEWWYQEKWDDTIFTQWQRQPADGDTVPDFTKAKIIEEVPHNYPELPITIIRHKLCEDDAYGVSEICDTLKEYTRKLTIGLSKMDKASQLALSPMYKNVNNFSDAEVKIRSGSIIDVKGDGDNQADFAPVDTPEIKEGTFKAYEMLIDRAYELKQVTSPSVEKEMKAGGTVSSVAFKQFNLAFIKKIDALRVRYGDEGIEAHIKKLLLNGKQMSGMTGYETVNPEDPATYDVQMVYPPFFEPTTEEKMSEVFLLKSAYLPAETLAERLAMVLDIQNEDTIKAMAQEIQSERDMMQPTIIQ